MPKENISIRFPMMDVHITTKGQDFNLKLNIGLRPFEIFV